ncbi:ABC transporter substrate-binding protein [Phycicoccus sp. BSK3Z-2]|uniref:ABC transporter substrate-binding protein n=1 Tax=Phycicoccus avicenniae TaxID=2828860 RepID=A0A941I0Z7_9MICO|nr:ABC transporter substrate-binding protein [Phycicoccus avicenniae]MBR7743584.1 ABC transporter substrate-binding protein [Phycicoccus avicenniae]
MTRRTTFLASATTALVAALALGGCVESGRSSTGAEGTECPWEADESIETMARIGYQNIPNGDLLVKDLGLLEACMPNADVQWTSFASGADVVQAYGDPSIDIGLMGSSPATQSLSEPLQLPISVVWVHDVIGAAESLVVRGGAADDLEGLEGSSIAVPFGSTAHYSLLQALQDADMSEAEDVDLINLAPENMPAAWQGGEIDAAWVWNPVLSELLADDGEIVLSSADTAEAGKPTYDLGTALDSFVEENPEFMVQWARAQDHAVGILQDDPATAAVSIAAEIGVSVEEAQELFEGYEYLRAEQQAGPDALGGKMAEDLATTADFLLSQGGIEAVADPQVYAEGVDATPAEGAAQ